MTVGLAALHFPRPEHRDQMISRVRRAAEVMAATPGCPAVGCRAGQDHQAVVTTGQREPGQAPRAGFAAVRTAGADFDYHERESRPRQVFTLAPHERPPGKPQLRCTKTARKTRPLGRIKTGCPALFR